MKKFFFIFSLFVLTEVFSMAESFQKASDGFVFIKGGTFLMGSPSSQRMRDVDEAQHSVLVADFWCDPYEVRQKNCEAVMKNNPSFFKGGDLPVESVSWFSAIEIATKKVSKVGLSRAMKYQMARKLSATIARRVAIAC